MKLKISIKIILLFVVAIATSFATDLLHNYLGDWFCEGATRVYKSKEDWYGSIKGCDVNGEHNPTWHWGYRHWLVFLMGCSLAIVQIVDIVNILIKKID